MHDAATIQVLATDILRVTRDHDVINRLQIAVGYSQLASMFPLNECYRLKLQKAIDELTVLVQKMPNAA